MNIKIYLDRYTETCCVPGTQFEQNATVIKFDFSELDFIDDECVKTIHFFHDSLEEMNYIGDSIIKNDEFEIPKSITKYENVVAFIQITKKDFIWKTKSFNLDFYDSLDVDKTLDEDEIGILQELILEVKEIQNITTEKFEEVAEKATEDFNKNATEKLNDFNDNYTDKLNSFNENSNSKVNNYNSNAESKTEDFNANADNQKSNFDNNVTEKTNTFNSNTESKITEFNSNATSKETAYNENATSKLNEYNENHTTKLNAYNENSADKIAELNDFAAEKIEEYDNHIEDLDNIVSKKTASGESISIDDALKYKIFDCKIDGNASQITTTGKQMLQMCAETRTQNGVTFIKNADGSVTLDGTATEGTFCNLNTSYSNLDNKKYFTLENGKTYTIYCKNISSNMYFVVRSRTQNDYLLDISDGNELAVKTYNKTTDEGCYGYLYVPTGSSFDNYTVYPMICEGQYESLEWEEYTGGEPSPSPDYKQAITTLNGDIKIVQIGQNAYNIANRKNPDGYPEISVDENDWVTIDNTTPTRHYVNFFTSNLKLKTDTDYAIVLEVKEASGDGKFILMSDDQDRGQFEETIMFEDIGEMGNNSVQVYIKKSKSSFEKSADGLRSFIETSNGQSNFITFRISVVEDTSITPETFVYKSYESNEYTINLQNNELVKLNDIKDTIEIDKNGNVSLSKRIGKVVLNGTENWIFNESGTNYIRFTLFIEDLINNQENNKKYVVSDYFVSSTINEAVTDSADANRICAVSNQRLLIKLVNDNVMNLDDFKAWLAEHNVTVYYELAEPTTSSLAQLTNFKTYAGINHFFLETNIATNFEIKYAQDLQKVISKQQAEIDELKTLLSSTATSALLLDNYESDLINEIESEVEQ